MIKPIKQKTSWLGFTLVELLIYMGLLVSFLLVLSAVFSITLSTQTDVIQTQQLTQDAEYLHARLQYDIHQATSITRPASNGATDTEFILTHAGNAATYFVDNGTLKRTTASGTHALTSPDTIVTAFAVERRGNDDGLSTLTIDATLTDRLSSETRQLHLTAGLEL